MSIGDLFSFRHEFDQQRMSESHHPSVDELGIQPALKANLKAAKIATIPELARELVDEAAFMKKVDNCGPKSVGQIKKALEFFRSKGKADPPPASGLKRFGGLIVVLFLAVVIVAYVEIMFGGGLSLQAWLAINLPVAVVATVALFSLFPDTRASVDGMAVGIGVGKWRLRASMTGASAATVIFYVLLNGTIFFFSVQIVQIRLVPKAGSGDVNVVRAGRIEIKYKRPAKNDGSTIGYDNEATVQDLPSWTKELVLTHFSCAGYLLAKQQAGEQPPWRFPIVEGEVQIEVVRRPVVADDLPEAKDVVAFLKRERREEKEIRKPGKYPRHQVWLSVENKTDREIELVVFDCIAALEEASGEISVTGGIKRGYLRNIQPDVVTPFDCFKDYDSAVGWFAVFVRFDNEKGDKRQRFLDFVNLFNTKSPRLVIRRDTRVAGEQFVIDRDESRLGE